MPVYNDERYLPEALESVLNQKDVELELIIVDDCSTDRTSRIIEQFKTSQIKYIRHNENKGQLDALLTGSSEITGDFVALFHGDDKILDDHAFVDYARWLSENRADGLYSDLVIIDKKSEVKKLSKAAKTLGKNRLIELLYRAGSNLIPDPFFVRKEFFFRSVLENYIKWNMAYWFNEEHGELSLGKVVYVNRPWYV